MTSGRWKFLIFLLITFACCSLYRHVMAQNAGDQPAAQDESSEAPPKKLTLAQSVMCERVEDNVPRNQAVAFSVSAGQVCCFTYFSTVPQPTLVYHRWYHHDELSTQIRLRLYPPRWATYSLIQLRETDKGPWRVEVSDQSGRILDVLRFSITD